MKLLLQYGQDILLHNWSYIKFFNHNFQSLLLHFSVDTDIIWCYMTLFHESVHSLLMSTNVFALWYEWKDKKGKIIAVCTSTSLWMEFQETISMWLFSLDLSCPVVYKCCTYPTAEYNWSRWRGSAGFNFEFLLCSVPKPVHCPAAKTEILGFVPVIIWFYILVTQNKYAPSPTMLPASIIVQLQASLWFTAVVVRYYEPNARFIASVEVNHTVN